MKHKTKRLFSGALAVLTAVLLVVSVFAPTASAAHDDYRNYRKYRTTIKLAGREAEGQYELTTKDLYLFSLEGTAPGDVWYGAVKVENGTGTDMAIRVKSITSNLKYDTTLFDALDLRISVAGKTMYRGDYAVPYGSVTDYVMLSSGDVMFFDIKVIFPDTSDNSCQGKQMDSTWTFDAVFFEPKLSLLDYTVYYTDQYFQNLLPEKVGHGYPNEIITEYAADIDGYVPDAQIKQLLLQEEGRNEIYFIYYPEDEGTPPTEHVDPSDPSDPGEPPGTATPLDPSDDVIKTGMDFSAGNTGLFPFLLLLLLAIITVVMSYFRIRALKTCEDVSKKEELPPKTSQKEDS